MLVLKVLRRYRLQETSLVHFCILDIFSAANAKVLKETRYLGTLCKFALIAGRIAPADA